MNLKEKDETLAKVWEVTRERSGDWPWLIICHSAVAKSWTTAVNDLLLCESALSPLVTASGTTKSLIHMDAWLDTNPVPHVIIVDEYDPQLKLTMRDVVARLGPAGHRLFFTKVIPEVPEPQRTSVVETLDFFKSK